MTVQFLLNPHNQAIVDVWLGDVFLGELRPTDRGFIVYADGIITTKSTTYTDGTWKPGETRTLEVIIEDV